MKLDAVAGKAARDQTLNSLVGGLAGWERACGNGGVWHQSILFETADANSQQAPRFHFPADMAGEQRAWRLAGCTLADADQFRW
jgi:hypothetical protein